MEREDRSMWLGIILVAVGTVLLLEKLGIITRGLDTYWPVILIAIGLAIVLNHWRRGPFRGR